jgi:hypothetical protein
MNGNHIAQRIVFWGSPARFANRCVVVVTGKVGLNVVFIVVISAVHESEVCAAVHHVEIERNTVAQVLIRFTCYARGIDSGMRLGPVCEPSGVEFGHKIRPLTAVVLVHPFAEHFYVVFTVAGGQRSLDAATFEQPCPVRSEHRRIETSCGKHFFYLCIVGAVLFQWNILSLGRIRTEFVLHLYHHYGPAFCDL